MSPPSWTAGESATKKGPKTVASVASPSGGALTATVSMETPRTSESSTNSCRVGVVMCPVAVRNSMPAFHSSSVSLTSRTKA